MTDNRDRIERTLELILYAPIGVGLFLKDTAPTFVNMFVSRGRAEIDRRQGDVQQHVTTARSLGQVAIAFGAPMVRERVERTVADARRRAEDLIGNGASSPEASTTWSPASETSVPATAVPAPVDDAPAPPAAASRPTEWISPASPSPSPAPPASPSMSHTVPGANGGDAPSSAGLPIPGYDALSASQVVERLTGLTRIELDEVHAYEASHRQRRTILGKIEQLAG